MKKIYLRPVFGFRLSLLLSAQKTKNQEPKKHRKCALQSRIQAAKCISLSFKWGFCGANYPHQALIKGGYFVFVWRIGT
jgi:hypothetical protein